MYKNSKQGDLHRKIYSLFGGYETPFSFVKERAKLLTKKSLELV